MPYALQVRIAVDMAPALAFFHQNRIIYRDLKVIKNILLWLLLFLVIAHLFCKKKTLDRQSIDCFSFGFC